MFPVDENGKITANLGALQSGVAASGEKRAVQAGKHAHGLALARQRVGKPWSESKTIPRQAAVPALVRRRSMVREELIVLVEIASRLGLEAGYKSGSH